MPAPKGNKYALGLTTSGRPRHYDETTKGTKALEKTIVEYFDYIQGEEGEETFINEKGIKVKKWTRNPEPPTITGLSLYLGFSNKSTLYEYAKKKVFSDSIKRALTIVEQNYEFNLFSKASTGAIFALKNMGWEDKQKFDHSNNGKEFNVSPIQWINGGDNPEE